jgi:predicted metal-dependent phosphoesterase TrpH
VLIDLHTHTRPISWDSFLTPDDLIEHARAAGLDGVVLCEHDFCWDPEEVRALAQRHNFLVLAGVEINTEEGHILVYGVDHYVYGMHRSPELAQVVERAGGAMVASHPYRRQMPWHVHDDHDYEEALQRASRNPAYRYCVALEKINGRGTVKENAFAARLCDFMGMPGTGGSDCHNRSDVGRCATYFQRRIETIEDLIEELKAGRFEAVDLRAKLSAG